MTPDLRIAELEKLLAEASARNAALEEMLQNSLFNSSKPASSDGPEKRAVQ